MLQYPHRQPGLTQGTLEPLRPQQCLFRTLPVKDISQEDEQALLGSQKGGLGRLCLHLSEVSDRRPGRGETVSPSFPSVPGTFRDECDSRPQSRVRPGTLWGEPLPGTGREGPTPA